MSNGFYIATVMAGKASSILEPPFTTGFKILYLGYELKTNLEATPHLLYSV